MTNRRQFIQSGIVSVSALAASEYASLSLALGHSRQAPDDLDAFLVDSRYEAGEAIADSFARQGTPLLITDGDLTEIWREKLDPAWRRSALRLAGATGADSLFVLETLAMDHGMRVVYRHPLEVYSALDPERINPLVSWVILPRHDI